MLQSPRSPFNFTTSFKGAVSSSQQSRGESTPTSHVPPVPPRAAPTGRLQSPAVRVWTLARSRVVIAASRRSLPCREDRLCAPGPSLPWRLWSSPVCLLLPFPGGHVCGGAESAASPLWRLPLCDACAPLFCGSPRLTGTFPQGPVLLRCLDSGGDLSITCEAPWSPPGPDSAIKAAASVRVWVL